MKKAAAYQSLFYAIILFAPLWAEEPKPLMIDSEWAHYDGKMIVLEGKSSVDHELGKVEAQKITLIPEKEGKKLRFSYLKMNGGVKIALQDGGELSCEEAEIDYGTLTGKFSGNPQHEYVTYNEYLKGQDSKTSIPLEVKGKEMSIQLKCNPQQLSLIFIDQIKAEDHVSISYNRNLFATADQGCYERKDNEQTKDKKKTGILSLYAKEKEGVCRINNTNGDLVDAKKICVDIDKEELQFEEPQGALFINDSEKGEIQFSCGSMAWSESQDILTMRDQVVVHYKGIGTLTNPNEIQVHRQLMDGHKQVSFIDCIGATELHYQDEKKHEMHALKTFQGFQLDHRKLQAHLVSPRDSNQQVLENLQVHFSDSMGEIFADEVFITYKEINKKMTPVKLFLKGNVWLLSRTSADKEDPGKILQFAMADRVEYDVAAKEVLCLADFNKRVLFFDKNNNLQISAPSVKAKRDPNTQKEAIQGMGDVRFSFIDQENEQMKKRFGSMGYE